MITIDDSSELKGSDFKNIFHQADCLEPWMESAFLWKENVLSIHQAKKPGRGSIPVPWWRTWYLAALAACQSNKWELTTGEVKFLDTVKTETIGDGVQIGEESKGKWHETFNRPEGGKAVGFTAPNHQETNAILAATKKRPELWTAGITTAKTKNGRGAVVVANRVRRWSAAGAPVPRGPAQIVGTFFHEIFHAGRIAQRREYADNREFFDDFVKEMERSFGFPNDTLYPGEKN